MTNRWRQSRRARGKSRNRAGVDVGMAVAIVPLTEAHVAADCYIYKHSTTCPISAMAGDFVRQHAWERPVYWVNVIEQRPLSNWVADAYHVRHQSPQLLKITAGEVEQHWSHYDINGASLAS